MGRTVGLGVKTQEQEKRDAELEALKAENDALKAELEALKSEKADDNKETGKKKA